MAQTAVVIGSTGLVGRLLVQQLVEHPEFERVVSYARRPLGWSHSKLVERTLPLSERFEERIEGDAFFSCMGTTIKVAGSREAFRRIDYEWPLRFAQACRAGGVRQCLSVSAMGANPGSPFFYPRVKGELEDSLIALKFPSLTIVRPSVLLGERDEERPMEAVSAGLLKVVGALLPGPLRHYRGVAAAAVAACLVRAALAPVPACRIILSGDIP